MPGSPENDFLDRQFGHLFSPVGKSGWRGFMEAVRFRRREPIQPAANRIIAAAVVSGKKRGFVQLIVAGSWVSSGENPAKAPKLRTRRRSRSRLGRGYYNLRMNGSGYRGHGVKHHPAGSARE